MKDLFKDLFNKTQCQRNGVCSTNPVIQAVEAVIINEIRQIAFFVVKLHEVNFTNNEIVKNTVLALSVMITDINFNKKSFFAFYSNLRAMKENIKKFYIEKSNELKISYEFINPDYADLEGDIDLTSIIKSGENIIREFYNTIKEEKFRLINLIILICKITSLKLVKLSEYKEPDFNHYYEILRLLALINHKTTREEKFIRRIKEFSNIIYQIQKELDFELSASYGKRTGGKISSNIYAGHSILVFGGDLDELYNLLEKTKNEEINVYINLSMISSIFYPKFLQFHNFKGIFGTNNVESDFSKFKGTIYITENSTRPLDLAFRGTIYSTKIIPQDKTIKIDKENLAPLIEETKKHEGFEAYVQGKEFDFEYSIEKIKEKIENNQDKKFLIYLGIKDSSVEENFKNYTILNFIYPYETEGLYYAVENLDMKNTSVFFSKCTLETVNTLISLIDRGLEKIYMGKCLTSDINPHIKEALQKDFNVLM